MKAVPKKRRIIESRKYRIINTREIKEKARTIELIKCANKSLDMVGGAASKIMSTVPEIIIVPVVGILFISAFVVFVKLFEKLCRSNFLDFLFVQW